MRLLIVLVLGLVFTPMLKAQNNKALSLLDEFQTKSESGGELVVSQSVSITNLLDTHLEVLDSQTGIDGFRVQLYLGSNSSAKAEASEAKTKFLKAMPNELVYQEYEAPFWRVQAGNFRSKNDALQMINRLKSYFPNCYAVPVSNIDYNKLN